MVRDGDPVRVQGSSPSIRGDSSLHIEDPLTRKEKELFSQSSELSTSSVPGVLRETRGLRLSRFRSSPNVTLKGL